MQTRNEDIVGQSIVEGVKVLWPVAAHFTALPYTIVKEKRNKVLLKYNRTNPYWSGLPNKWVSPKRCLIVSY